MTKRQNSKIRAAVLHKALGFRTRQAAAHWRKPGLLPPMHKPGRDSYYLKGTPSRHLATPEFKADEENRTELKANSFLWTMLADFYTKYPSTRARFPSEGLVATPEFLIRPAASHNETRYLRIRSRTERSTACSGSCSTDCGRVSPEAVRLRTKRF